MRYCPLTRQYTGINVLALDQTLRQVNIQFVVERDDFEKAQKVLHHEFVEKGAIA